MHEFQDDTEVDELFRAVLDQNLTVTQVRRLEEILLSDPKVREDYLRLTEIDHFLQVCYHGEDSPATVPPPKPAGPGIRAFWITWVAAVCVVLTFALSLLFRSGTQPETEAMKQPVSSEPIDEIAQAAVLTASIYAEWAQDADINQLPNGSVWNVGDWIELKKGTAILTFANGVQCAITGEVRLQIDVNLNCFLDAGICTFHVPSKATGFTVHTHSGSSVSYTHLTLPTTPYV